MDGYQWAEGIVSGAITAMAFVIGYWLGSRSNLYKK